MIKAAREANKNWDGFLLKSSRGRLQEFLEVCVEKGGVRAVVNEREFGMDAWDEFCLGRSKGKIVVKIA